MSAKIAKTVHLSAAQWRILDSLMVQPISSTTDDSVRAVAEIVRNVARGGGDVVKPRSAR